MQPQQSRESEDDPQHSWGEVRGGHSRWIPGVIKNDETEKRKDDRREERRARSELDREILAGDEPSPEENVSHLPPASRGTWLHRSWHRACARHRIARTCRAALRPRAWPARVPQRDCASR